MKQAIFLLLFFPCLLNAQLHDNTWIIGYENNKDTSDKFGISVITFPDARIRIDQNTALAINFDATNASFSDSSGQISSYSNGIHIGNPAWQMMENGKFIGSVYPEESGYIWPQWVLMLPYPGKPNHQICFYEEEAWAPVISAYGKSLRYAEIDMNANNGLGKVTQRDVLALDDSLTLSKLTATKHANGRDWWMMLNEVQTNRFYQMLITPEGPKVMGSQTIGETVFDGVGQAVFSPDGSHFAVYNSVSTALGIFLDIYDFNRCSGLLSNHRHFHYTGAGVYGGIAFSPNSRYLYGNYQIEAFQFDMEAADVVGSRKKIMVYDGFMAPFVTHAFYMQTAPDGKIYSCTVSGSNVLHVIHSPDEPGEACQYQQHGITLPTYNSKSIPNHPNYRLGPLDGSPCDTLGLDNRPIAWWRSDRDTLNALRGAFHDLSYYEPTAWLWDFGDGQGSTEQHPAHKYAQASDYKVCLTVSNANSSHTLCRVLRFGTVAAKDPEIQSAIQVSPNPFQQRLSVSLSASLRSPVFHLCDMLGHLVLKQPLAFGITEVETGGLAAGIYFWQMSADGEVLQTGKVVKM